MSSNNKITKKELRQGFWRSFTTSHAWHYERQQHMSFAYMMIPIINKLYDNREERIEAYHRHLEFYNSQTTMQSIIFGVTAAMEEENVHNDEFDTSSISAMKVAMMGPLAGIGDSLLSGTLRIIATGIVAGMSMAGSILGPILFLLIYNIPNISLRYLGVKHGYGIGTNLVKKISDTNVMNKLTLGMAIVGLMVIGSMIASTVSVTTPIAFNVNNNPFSLQETLDSIFPKLLPVLVTYLLYTLNKKRINVLWQIVGIMVLAVALGAFGILG